MAPKGRVPRAAGIALGLILLSAGVLGAVLLSRPQPEPMAQVPIRPVKTALVGGPVPATQRRYPGKVRAGERVQLSFEVSGAIEDLPVKSGQKVQKGQPLARLDPRDYQNTLNAQKAIEEERRINLERIRDVFNKGAATEKEVSQASASYDVAKAQLAIGQKALEDTVIHAPFDGVVAYVLVRQYQKVGAKEPILSLQDPSRLEVVINLPEQVMAFLKPGEQRYTLTASFDYLPGQEIPMTVKEYATEADQVTQTYPVTLEMPAPENFTILPGMSATVTVATPPILGDKSEGYLLPLTAVPANGQGQFYVWIVESADGAIHTVRRQGVTVGPMTKEYVLVTDGVTADQRVVTAGVHLLEDGQQVRLLDSNRGEGGI